MNKLTLALVAALAGLALVGIVVLTAMGVPVPELLGYAVTTGLGGLVGSLLPRTPADPPAADPGPSYPVPTALVRTDTGNLLHPRVAA